MQARLPLGRQVLGYPLVDRGEGVAVSALLPRGSVVARIRTIKPDFWTDETLGECSPTARLLFVGTWNLADDHGNLERSSRQLKAQLFPYDNFDCEPLVVELLNAGVLIEYEVAVKKYLHIKGFEKHQKVEKKSSPRHPLYDESAKSPRVLPDSSPTSSGSSLGREGKGREKEGSKDRAHALADARSVRGVNLEALDRWIGYRAERKPAIKTISLRAAAEELATFGDQQAAVVQHSIANGYQGLIAPKVNGNGAHHSPAVPFAKSPAELEAIAIETAISAGKTDREIHAEINSQFVSLDDIRRKREEMQHAQH
jgi:hypothetical protein